MELVEFKAAVDQWLDAQASELTPDYDGIGTLDAQMAHLRKVMRLAYDAGFMRMGWPERVGGLGGSNLLRAYLGEQLTAREFVEPGIYSLTEVLAPTMIDFALPALAADMIPRLLSGEETWCQGFSETGNREQSRLAHVPGHAGRRRLAGQRPESLDQPGPVRARCVLLTRTGSPESAHRGITAFFIDMDTPGITVRPIRAMHGVEEFSEVFYDDVRIPDDRLLGQVDGGWAIAMDLLPYERSTALWHRAAYMQRRLERLVREAPPGALDPVALGEAMELLWAFKARSRATQRRLAAGETLGAETSIDKALVAAAEQAVFDLAAEALGTDVALGDDPASVALARRVPVLARRHHLRRQLRDPAQHHCPPPARLGGRPVMEDEERALFAESMTRCRRRASGEALDLALDDLGWRDALAVDRGAAVSLLFDAAGPGQRHLFRPGLAAGRRPGRAEAGGRRAAAPAPWAPPGRSSPGRCAVAGLGPATLARQSTALVVAAAADGGRARGAVGGAGAAPGRRHRSGARTASRCAATSSWAGPDRSSPRVGRRGGPGPARAEPRAGRRSADNAGTGLPARHRTRAVRPAHRMFQAVRHRLAESLIAIEAADSLLAGAWDEPSPVLAAMAKGMACRGSAPRGCRSK